MKIFEALQNNDSVVLTGKTGTGKTTVLKILVSALQKLKLAEFSSIKVSTLKY
jgi:tRNA A37 threonylcarbamoyladenosine biosynthesis protein TsaE